MNWTKLAIATTLAAALIASPATAYADCGDPGQDPCTGPVPTVDEIVAVMQQLTDPNIPAANKSNIVSPGLVQARNAERAAASADTNHTPQGSISFVGVDGEVERFADDRGRRFTPLGLYRHTRFDGDALYRDAVGQSAPAPLCARA